MATQPQVTATSIDWAALIAKLTPVALAMLQLLLQQLAGQTPVQAATALQCGPDGCKVCPECLDAAIKAQIQGLALSVQARGCPDCGG